MLIGVSESKQKESIYKQVEPIMIELICFILGSNGEYLEYMETGIDLLTLMTYYPDVISEGMWQCFPKLYEAFDLYAFDYITSMCDPIDNFIEKSPQLFLSLKTPTNVRYIDLAVQMVKKVLENDTSDEVECRKSLIIVASILLNCKGGVDEYLPIINHLLLEKLTKVGADKLPHTRIAILQCLGCAFFYNADLQMAELEKRSYGGKIVGLWFKEKEGICEKWLACKCTIVGWLAMLTLGSERLVRSGIDVGGVLSGVIEMSKTFNDEHMNRTPNNGNRNGGGDWDGEDDFQDMGHFADGNGGGGGGGGGGDIYEDDGELWEEGGEFDEGPVTDIERPDDLALGGFMRNMKEFGEEGDYEWGGEEDGDGEDYHKVMGDIQELQLLEDVLKGCLAREPHIFGQLQQNIKPEIMASYLELAKAAEQQREEEGKNS